MSVFKHARKCGVLVLAALMLGILATACSSGNPPVNSSNATYGTAADTTQMEAVHASYLDLTSNIADLRSRVDQWTKGDESSLNIAKEKLERIDAIVAATNWSPIMQGAIGKVRTASAPMAKALNATDAAASATAAKSLGDASHDVTHAFYGDWLPGLKGQRFSAMASHAIYLDLSANIADLRSRIGLWAGGDENSLNIANEKLERIIVLHQHASATNTLAKPLTAIQSSLLPITAALEQKDAAATQAALKPLSDASHDLTHDFYGWMGATNGANDSACVQAAYLDLTLNIADLKTRITAWEKGDESSLNIAQEKLDRIGAVLAHTGWPQAMAASVLKVNAAVPTIAQTLKLKDIAQTQAAVKPMSDASHDVTHAYYGDWLPHAQMVANVNHSGMQHGNANSGSSLVLANPSNHSDSHPHGETAAPVAPDPNKPRVLGGFGLINAMVIAAAAVLKIRTPKKGRAAVRNEKTQARGVEQE